MAPTTLAVSACPRARAAVILTNRAAAPQQAGQPYEKPSAFCREQFQVQLLLLLSLHSFVLCEFCYAVAVAEFFALFIPSHARFLAAILHGRPSTFPLKRAMLRHPGHGAP